MIIREFFKENNVIISDKGEECLIAAVRDVFPALRTLPIENVMAFFYIDLPEKDCIKILHRTVKYAKLYIFS